MEASRHEIIVDFLPEPWPVCINHLWIEQGIQVGIDSPLLILYWPSVNPLLTLDDIGTTTTAAYTAPFLYQYFIPQTTARDYTNVIVTWRSMPTPTPNRIPALYSHDILFYNTRKDGRLNCNHNQYFSPCVLRFYSVGVLVNVAYFQTSKINLLFLFLRRNSSS